MKIVLTSSEVNQIIVDYLASQGTIENKVVYITWELDHWHVKKPIIIVEQ
ncbi:MAG: hypothetical protein UHD64_10165 [Bacteroidales bacterium]|nr:hypothetical protein [Bacteroidales bacterium]